MKIKDKIIDQYNNRITGRIAKPVNKFDFVLRAMDELIEQNRLLIKYIKS